MHEVDFDRIAGGQVAMFAGADGGVKRGKFGLGEGAVIFEAGAIAFAVAIAGIGGEIAAAVFGVFVEVDVAECHGAGGGGRCKAARVVACGGVDVAGRLRPKAFAFGGGGEGGALRGDRVVAGGGAVRGGQGHLRGEGCGEQGGKEGFCHGASPGR